MELKCREFSVDWDTFYATFFICNLFGAEASTQGSILISNYQQPHTFQCKLKISGFNF